MPLTEYLRSFKISYEIYNFFHPSKLNYLKKAYKKYGIKRPIFRTINAEYLAKNGNAPAEKPWLDDLNYQSKLAVAFVNTQFDTYTKSQIQQFSESGFAIFPSYFSTLEVDQVNDEIDKMIAKQEIGFRYNGKKIMFAHKHSSYIKTLISEQKLIDLLSFILGKKVIPFQTINFIHGSGQKTHSDTIHMATYPLGFLIAVWVALEDIQEESGPLHYYPKSHTLPYILSHQFETGNTKYRIGDNIYTNYEHKIEEVIEEKKLTKETFCAKKGDIFIWHANVLHGGNPVINPQLTRKSMVVHYYCEDVICYHEITQRAALIDF